MLFALQHSVFFAKRLSWFNFFAWKYLLWQKNKKYNNKNWRYLLLTLLSKKTQWVSVSIRSGSIEGYAKMFSIIILVILFLIWMYAWDLFAAKQKSLRIWKSSGNPLCLKQEGFSMKSWCSKSNKIVSLLTFCELLGTFKHFMDRR